MRRRPLLFAALVLGAVFALTLAAPAAQAQTVKSDYDKKADFTTYKTFTFKKGTDAPTPFAQERIVGAIANQLKARGLTQSETADLLVYTHTQVSTEQRVDTTGFGYGGYPGWGGWGGGFATSSAVVTEIPIGTVIVDLVDAKTNELVWRGIASDTLLTNPTPEKSEKRINKAITKLFSKYPVEPIAEKKK
ncbi:MAG TPA: DUF4136 domain-containing protein [Candidatus Polarisedimenticolia bacterium]|nr:DUF4136 domain-containing protein [Candidatus Polarisedimenticolia bacterium]